MSLKGKAYVVGAYEHPTRKAPDKSLAQLHAEVAKGALDDAGLSKNDVDGYFCASGDTPGLGGLSMATCSNLMCNSSSPTGQPRPTCTPWRPADDVLLHLARAAVDRGRATVEVLVHDATAHVPSKWRSRWRPTSTARW
jgi:hypothetical protein